MRKMTCTILEAIDEGLLDPKYVAEACLQFMSEDDVKLIAHNNELFPPTDEDEVE